jgi:hypothetical protein
MGYHELIGAIVDSAWSRAVRDHAPRFLA